MMSCSATLIEAYKRMFIDKEKLTFEDEEEVDLDSAQQVFMDYGPGERMDDGTQGWRGVIGLLTRISTGRGAAIKAYGQMVSQRK